MVEPQSEISTTAEIDAEKKLALTEIVVYLDEYLPNFPSFFKKKTSIKKIKVEKKISRELCLFLNNVWDQNKTSIFHFYPEWEYDNSHRSSDFGVIDVRTESNKPTETFFVIEAKRLPTGSGREKEYIEGNLGGIERYKRGHHSAGLPQSAIVGYIQKENCSHWHAKINEWIKELSSSNTDESIKWNSDDLLVQSKNFGKTKKYHSKSTRIIDSEEDSIELYHYLMELN